MGSPARIAALLAALLLLVSACAMEIDHAAPGGDTVDAGDIEQPQGGSDLVIGLEILEGPGGGTLAFVPVTIQGQGPYAFALDTGASHSVLDESIADELELQEVGEPREVTGVIGGADARQAQIEQWQAGDVELGARPVVVLNLEGPREGAGIQGLLGSDVLSEFGAVLLDYDTGELVLRPRAEAP